MSDKVAVINCDNCQGAIYSGEKVLLCEDGGVVHNHCLEEYVMKLADPISVTVDEIVGKCA